MNRILLMVLRNITRVPGAYMKLCRYAKQPDKYPEEEMYKHIRYILNMGVDSGSINLKIVGKENFPKENGFIMYSNHQGLFDVVAMVAACEMPIATIFKHEIKNLPFIRHFEPSFTLHHTNTAKGIYEFCSCCLENCSVYR